MFSMFGGSPMRRPYSRLSRCARLSFVGCRSLGADQFSGSLVVYDVQQTEVAASLGRGGATFWCHRAVLWQHRRLHHSRGAKTKRTRQADKDGRAAQNVKSTTMRAERVTPWFAAYPQRQTPTTLSLQQQLQYRERRRNSRSRRSSPAHGIDTDERREVHP